MITIYTDGAARGNPGRAGWGAVIINKEEGTVLEIGGHSPHATNNQMELTGAIKALEYVSEHKKYAGQKIALYTDSSYVIRGMKQWIFNWQKNGWQTSQKKSVENMKLWQELMKLSDKKDIEWLYVPGHSGVPLNERTDSIATGYADSNDIKLFSGAIEEYSYDINVSSIVKRTTSKQKTAKKGYYVVVRSGKVFHYETWKECEDAVKGVKGVRFKKVSSKEDEKRFLESIL